MADWRDDLEQFQVKTWVRMVKGEEEYGNESLSGKPDLTTVREIQEELEDVANWAFILWRKLDKIIL